MFCYLCFCLYVVYYKVIGVRELIDFLFVSVYLYIIVEWFLFFRELLLVV